ncbi:lipocalin family protein [Chitinophaga sp. RAB17]|uniref:lipocalin family protein n=1 Tax=Chitinophaga sp. RAB17 TaxID=3233049 RepID=UPI003F8E43AF
MKTTTMKWALIAMTAGTMIFACKKEKSSTPECSINVTSLSGAYKLTALQYKASATAAPVDYLAFMEPCEKDDIITLKSDGTYKYNNAGTVCESDKIGDGTWQLSGNTLTSDGQLNGTIASYDCKTLTYYVENSIQPGDKLVFTMVKQ